MSVDPMRDALDEITEAEGALAAELGITLPAAYGRRWTEAVEPVIRARLAALADYARAAFHGRPAWQHDVCGRIETIDLIDLAAFQWRCPGCLMSGAEQWRPVFAYLGRRCDQCAGNGSVPVTGHVTGAPTGYETSAGCTACGGSGRASVEQLAGEGRAA